MATTGTVELAQTARIASMASQLHSTKEDLQDVAVTDEDKGKCANRTITTRVAQGVAGASIVLNIVAMALSFSGFTLLAGIVALIIGPIVIMQQFALQDTGTMREVQNKLRQRVNDLSNENNTLSASNTVLEDEVGQLREQEARLERITAEQGSNVNEFVGLVKENKEILVKQQYYTSARVLQDITDKVLRADANDDGIFTDAEIMSLLNRHLKSVLHYDVNEPALKKKLDECGRSVDGMIAVIRELNSTGSGLPEEDRIFIPRPVVAT